MIEEGNNEIVQNIEEVSKIMEKALDDQEKLQSSPMMPPEPETDGSASIISENERIHRKMIERMERSYVDSSYIK